MARKVKRKATGVRRAANSRSRASKARAATRQGKGVVNSALSALPISQQQLQGTFLVLILAGALAAAWFVARAAGVPALMEQQIAASAGSAGFQMRNIDLTGVERMNRLKVYEEVMEHRGTPMPNPGAQKWAAPPRLVTEAGRMPLDGAGYDDACWRRSRSNRTCWSVPGRTL